MATATGSDFDARLARLFGGDPEALANPVELYNELRRDAPVYEFRGIGLVSRHDDARELMRDPVRFSNTKGAASQIGRRFRASLTAEQQRVHDEVASIEARWMTRLGGQEHLRVRAAAHRAFTPRRVAGLRAATMGYVHDMLDGLSDGDAIVDLMPLAYRVPLMVVGDLLGAPMPDREAIYGWSRRIAGNLGTYRVDALLDAHRAYREFSGYVEDLLTVQRRSPCADDLGSLLHAAESEGTLTTEDVVAMYIVLLFAGHETTTNLIATGVYELLSRREQWLRLVADPATAPGAVEELLRFVSPIQWNLRQATSEINLRGFEIAAGQDVQLILAAANRDPAIFAHPDELDIHRSNAGQHLAFGFGRHFCLGSSLARLEGQIALQALATRFPYLELAGEDAEWEGTANLRKLRSLPVRLGPDRRSPAAPAP